MSEYISYKEFEEAKKLGLSLKDFMEAKKKLGLVFKKAGLPNQDIPKADKGPELLKLKGSLAGKDYKGQLTTNPVKGTEEDPLPYKGGETKKGKELLVSDEDPKDGFAFKGNKVLNPTNSAPIGFGKSPEMQTDKVKHKAKMTSEEFVTETKNMSPKEFINFFLESSDEPLPTITDLYGNEFTPDPTQTIQYMAALMTKSPRLLSRFVREMKRQENGMHLLMREAQDHPEFYTLLAEGMAEPDEGRKRCHRIAKSMNDNYMDVLNQFVMEQKINEEIQPKNDLAFEDGGPIGNIPQNPSGTSPQMKPQQPGGAFGGGGPQGGGPQSPPQGGAFGGGGPGQGVDIGMPGADTGAAPPGMGASPPPMPPGGAQGGGVPPSMPPATASGGPPGFDSGLGGQPNLGTPMPKLNRETAHGNMIHEMGDFPHMRQSMIDHCINKPCK